MGEIRRRWHRLWVVGAGLAATLVLAPLAWGQAVQVERPVGTIIASEGIDAQGWRRAGAGHVTLTYTVRNTGAAQLDVTNVTSGDLVNVTVNSIVPTAFSVAPSETGTVEIRYTPSTDGSFSFDVTITSNAPDYAWTVSGEGDATPPTVPVPLTPSDGLWLNTTQPSLTWEASTDGGSGVRDYRVLIYGPVERDYYTMNTFYTPNLQEGAFYLRMRARDWVANVSDYTTDRWFYIDLTPPLDPTLSSPSHTVGVPSNNPDVQIEATGASDPVSGGVSSGVAGFEVAWNQSETWSPAGSANRGAGWAGETFVATSDGSWWVHVATVDGAGNWTSTEHLGPFDIDTIKPSVVSVAVGTNLVYKGDLTQEVTVTFDEAMDTAVPPHIMFSVGKWEYASSGRWDVGQTVWTQAFTLENDWDKEVSGVTVEVRWAQDAAGNPQEPHTPEALFDIDTIVPRVSAVEVDTDPMYEGDLTQRVTVTFAEVMDTGVVPVIAFNEGTFTSNGDGQWDIGQTVWMETFTLTNNSEEITGVTVSVSGGKDAAGNLQVPYESAGLFDIDTRKPEVALVNPVVVDTDPMFEGDLTQRVTVTFAEVMDTGVTPVMAFSEGTFTSNGDGQWNIGQTVWMETFTLTNNSEEITGVTVSVSGGKDAAGNLQVPYESAGLFDIDTDKPSVLNVGVDTDPMYEGDLTQRVTVTFAEVMDTGVTPVMAFSEGTFTSNGDGQWNIGQTVWMETFTLTNNSEEITGVTVSVSGGKDAAGNLQVPYESAGLFDIDTIKPRATVMTNRTTIAGGSPVYEQAASRTLTVTVTYDEAMNQSTTPTITLAGHTPARWMGPTGGAWTSSTVYTAQFTHDGIEEPMLPSTVITAFARVGSGSGATDLAGNTDVGGDSPVFDIDTRKPRATVTTDRTTIAGGSPVHEQAASRTLTVTVTYDEDMDQMSTPTRINLINAGNHWSGPANGQWTSPRVYTAQFAHDGTEEEIAGGTYASLDSTSGATDLAGNGDLGNDSDPFDIDTRKPRATVTTDRTTIAGGSPVYEQAASRTLTVTVTYDEAMNQSTTPSITLVNAGAAWSGPSGGTWNNATEYEATFTHNGTQEEIPGSAFARVACGSGATDLAGNTDVGGDSPVFDIDTRKPVATVTTDHTTIAGGSPIFEGSLVLTVTVTYDEPMDTMTEPTITLQDAGTHWGAQTSLGWTGNTIYRATFTHDGTQEPMLPGTVITAFARVSNGSGATDLAGNADVGGDSAVFDIDTRKPRATVTTDHTTIADGSPIFEGSLVLTVTVTYDEPMNPATTPEIALPDGSWGPPDGYWADARTYVATFTHDGVEEPDSPPDVPITTFARVADGSLTTPSGATDLAGNAEVGNDSAVFDIDTRKPQATVTTDHTTIADGSPVYEGSLLLTVTVTYDEDMDETTTPTIELVDHTPERWTGPTGGGWSDPRTYIATFTHDGGEDEVDGVVARVADRSGARDLAGNAEVGDVSDPFDVDTIKPEILLIEADESGMCDPGCYVLGSVCPPGAFGVTVEFSEAVWQLAGDALVLTFNLDNPGSGTLAFSSIAPDSVTAPSVWQPQEEARTYVVQDGDNTCRLAVTEIALQRGLFDAAGNRFVVPSHPLGDAHNITDNQDINVDTTRPEIHDLMFNTDATHTERETDYYVDTCCVTTVYFSAHVTDNCYVLTGNVHVTVTLPTDNAILEDIQIALTQTTLSRVDITGSAVVRCLTSCPARVEVLVEARDCRGGPACCGNWAVPRVTAVDEGLIWDTVPPFPRDDPRQDMIADGSAIIDPLVEVRRDDLGVYRLLVRENTPVRIDVLRNDADNCSCRCDGGPHPFDPCGPCSACSGCCAALFLHEIVDPPAFGTATVEDDTGDCAGGTVIRYAPKLGYVGPDWFTYTIRDACGNVSAAIATVYLQVIPELAMEDVFVVACASATTQFTVRAADLWVDYDPHDIPFRFSIVAGPEHGAVVGDPGKQALVEYSTEIVDGRLVPTLTFIEAAEVALVYIPAAGYTGPDEIWIQLEDPFGSTQTARIALAVSDCTAEGATSPSVTVSRGRVLSIIPPTSSLKAALEVGLMPVLISLDDGAGHAQAIWEAWVDTLERNLLFLDTGRLLAGRYLLVIPLAHGERVEIVVVVKEEA